MNGAARLDHAVILTGQALAEAAYLVSLGLRVSTQRNGVDPTQSMWDLGHLLRTTSEASRTSRRGSQQFPEQVSGAALELTELLSTKEAAAMLDITPRQVRNLAATLGAQRAGRLLMVDRGAVEAELARRQEASS